MLGAGYAGAANGGGCDTRWGEPGRPWLSGVMQGVDTIEERLDMVGDVASARFNGVENPPTLS